MTAGNSAPVTAVQLHALLRSATRELGWGLRAVNAEVGRWHSQAATIPDPRIRQQVLEALHGKRPLIDGAALFWTLPDRRNPELLRLLVAFQILANFHDNASEAAARGQHDGPGSSIAPLLAVVDTSRPPPAYHGNGPQGADGGYLHALSSFCRARCSELPRYDAARIALIRHTGRARSLDIEHDLDASRRNDRLQRFAEAEFPDRHGASWWELAAGTGSLLSVIVLLALAGDKHSTADDFNRSAEAYILVGSISALLDNYVDQFDDADTGAHNYFNYYASPDDAIRGLATLIARASRAVGALRNGERHHVIVASMTAMFLTHANARGSRLRHSSTTLATSGGTLTRLLVPILRAWRSLSDEPAG